jgi:hypothetical protein
MQQPGRERQPATATASAGPAGATAAASAKPAAAARGHYPRFRVLLVAPAAR